MENSWRSAIFQSDRTNTACANQLSAVVDDVRHRHSEDSKRIMNFKDYECNRMQNMKIKPAGSGCLPTASYQGSYNYC